MADPTPDLFTFSAECPVDDFIRGLMVEGEEAVAAYRTVRDIAVFTTKRLLIRDAQGITGKKVEVYSVPWKAVNMWSSENAGAVDRNSEIELWTRAGHMKVNLKRGIDIRKLDRVIARCVLND